MAIRFPKQVLHRSIQFANQAVSTSLDVPKGHLAVYVGENQKKQFVIPLSFLDQPAFRTLLTKAEEEFGFDHPMGGLTIPCREDIFVDLTYHLNRL